MITTPHNRTETPYYIITILTGPIYQTTMLHVQTKYEIGRFYFYLQPSMGHTGSYEPTLSIITLQNCNLKQKDRGSTGSYLEAIWKT